LPVSAPASAGSYKIATKCSTHNLKNAP
jgi:hypothetical protein